MRTMEAWHRCGDDANAISDQATETGDFIQLFTSFSIINLPALNTSRT